MSTGEIFLWALGVFFGTTIKSFLFNVDITQVKECGPFPEGMWIMENRLGKLSYAKFERKPELTPNRSRS